MAVQVIRAHIEGIHANAGTIGSETVGSITLHDAAGTAIAGYVSPNLDSLQVVHLVNGKRIMGQRGQTTGLLGIEDGIECSFDVIFEGSTRANALISATLPNYGTKAVIAGLPVIACGPFSDALNSDGTSNSYPWIYEGQGTITGKKDDCWSGTLKLTRFRGIPTWSAIS